MTSTTTTHREMSPQSKSKTIRPPGSNTTRVSVACDRCRKKKIRCFYDDADDGTEYPPGMRRPCANCKAVGLECIFTDKLARKAFPRGYTESLEERVRELEFENKKLQKLLTLRNDGAVDEPRASSVFSESVSPPRVRSGSVSVSINNGVIPGGPPGSQLPLNDESLSLLNSQTQQNIHDHLHLHDHDIDEQDLVTCGHIHDDNCNCGMAHSVHNRPVSIAGSVDIDRTGELSDDDVSLYSVSASEHYSAATNVDDLRNRYGYNSFEQANAPGAAAAISLQNRLRTKNFMDLANLIAASIPRSTEETLFIPTLLAKIVSVHGFQSKAPYLTARTIALLKESEDESRYSQYSITFKGVNFHGLTKDQSIQFFQGLNLPNYMNLDLCITVFFDTWNMIIPVLNKDIFMNNYLRFSKSRENGFQDGEMLGFEKFGELLVIITALVMLSHERNNAARSPDGNNSTNTEVLQFYDHMIKQFIESNLNTACSISSLQMVTIELLYCLTTGDLTTSYEVRGKMVTMSQQLRLQRCPAAVLGSNGSSVSKLQQGERRILFWSIYTLDSFSAFILGVPRLLKDYEIECALPSSSASGQESNDPDSNMITFNNIQLSLVGKVSDSALSVMRYAKILGTIVDIIFRRSNNNLKKPSVDESTCLILEEMLDSWRREMPKSVSIERLDVSGNLSDYEKLSDTQLTLLYLYYQAKALIYMPLMASGQSTKTKNSPAFISIHQATTAILTITRVLNSPKHNYYYMPIPMNLSRQKARFALLAAKGSLEHTRGGALFQESKNLLGFVVSDLKSESDIDMLGCLSQNCAICLEQAVDAILAQPKPTTPSTMSPPPGLRHGQRKPSVGENVRVKKEDDSGALNDIFSKSGYSMRTLQQQMRQQPAQMMRQPNRSASVSSQTAPVPAAAQWNPDNFGSYKQEQEQQLNESLQEMHASDMMNFTNAQQQQQDKNLNDMLQQVSVQQEDSDALKSHMQNHFQTGQQGSYSDLLMLGDFGVDASLGLPLADFELDSDAPTKKMKKSSGSLFTWN